jgi:hypothetical protein
MTPIFPIAYFGNIAYYKSLFSCEAVQLECYEHFVKQSIRNRCDILTSNGVLHLSIPIVRNNGSKTLIKDVLIDYNTDWRKNHWKAIESAYASSPYFEHYSQDVYDLIYQEETSLIQFNFNINKAILSWLGIETKVSLTTEYEILNELKVDYRSTFNKNEGTSQFNFNQYTQVFEENQSFTPNLSILDAIFALGPMARTLIDKI